MALPAFAAARRAAAPCCCGAGRAAIDQYLLPAGLTAANPPHAAAAGKWDRQRDTVPFQRPRSAYYAGIAKKFRQRIAISNVTRSPIYKISYDIS